MTEIIHSLDEIAGRYDALFCDLWGCVHDGAHPFPAAVAALRRFRARGGVVVFLTNSPRPRARVARQLEQMKLPRDCWDTIATSGDGARAAMFRGVIGSRVYHIGAPTDFGFFAPMAIVPDPIAIKQVALAQAEGIVCTGPFDPMADPEVNRPDFLYAKEKDLKLLCANPDIVVDKGGVREWCAGALARLYTEMGGTSLYFGKPYPPIYDLARQRLAKIRKIPDAHILCIGDGIATDVAGAIGEDLDVLFITGGLSASEFGPNPDAPDPTRLEAFLTAHRYSPLAAIGQLR